MSSSSAKKNFEIKIPGIELLEKIGEGSSSIVYKATHKGQKCAVRILKNVTADSFQQRMSEYRKEAATLGRIRHSSIPKIMEVGAVGSWPYMIMELFEGSELNLLIANNILSEQQALQLGVGLLEAVGALHQLGLSHQDIKPENIILSAQDQVHLVDLQFASEGHQGVGQFSGTMVYSSPEQLGVLRIPVDHRTDIYSCGVVLYKAVTGRLPSESTEVGEIIKFHMTKVALLASEINPAISLELSKILAKALAKDPQDRYQTSAGFEYDLRQLLELKKSRRPLSDFVIGSQDDSLLSSQEVQLVGREQELKILEERWKSRTGEMVLVSGPSGSGKSRLIRELCRKITTPEMLLALAKCTEVNQIPFYSWRIIVDDILLQLQNGKIPDAARILSEIKTFAVGSEAILAHISPRLELLLSESGSAASNAAISGRNNELVGIFLAQLFRSFPQIQIVIDDIQWMDEASREVLGYISDGSKQGSQLLIIMSARSEESYSGAVAGMIERLGSHLSEKVDLHPFTEENLSRLLKNLLGGVEPESNLVQYIAARSDGIPFTAQEYLRLMMDEGAVSPSWGRWVFNTEVVKRLNLPHNLKDVVLNRIQLIPLEQSNILRAAAVIGTTFSAEQLILVSKRTQAEVFAALKMAIENGLIEATLNQTYEFAHDSILEALLLSATEDSIKDWNYTIASLLENRGSKGWSEIYSLAHHYAKGRPELSPELALRAHITAGKLSLEKYANGDATAFFEWALHFAERSQLPIDPVIFKGLGVAFCRMDGFALATQYLEKALSLATERLEKASLRFELAVALRAQRSYKKAWVEIQKGFVELGSPLSKSPIVQTVLTLFYLVMGMLSEKTGFLFGSKNQEKLARLKVQSSLASIASEMLYFDMRPIHMLVIGFYSLYIGCRIGRSVELVGALSRIAVAFMELKMPRLAHYYISRAEQMSAEIGSVADMALCQSFHGMMAQFGGQELEAEAVAKKLLLERGKFLLPDYYLNSVGQLLYNYIIRGRFNVAASHCHDVFIRMRRSSFDHPDIMYSIPASALAILGHSGDALEVLERIPAGPSMAPEFVWIWSLYLCYQMYYCYDCGKVGPDIQKLLNRWDQLQVPTWVVDFYHRPIYILRCYIEIDRQILAFSKRQKPDLSKLKLEIAAGRGVNFVGAQAVHRKIILAAEQILSGRFSRGLKMLDEAESKANQVDCLWGLLEIYRFRAHVRALIGETLSAQKCYEMAHEMAIESGSVNRPRRLIEEFNAYGYRARVDKKIKSESSVVAMQRDVEANRGKTHLEALAAVSRSTTELFDVEKQVRDILLQVVKVFGAERAVIFRLDEKQNTLRFADGYTREDKRLSEMKGYSTTFVTKAMADRTAISTNATDQGEVSTSTSVVAFGLKSMMAAPIVMRDQVLGVIYLDNTLARGVFQQEDLNVLSAISSQIAVAFENSRTAGLEVKRRMLEKDFELSASVQKMLLPSQSAYSAQGLNLAGYYRPADQCGGDWWWYNKSANGNLSVVVGDVTGHGAGPAMITASIAAFYRVLTSDDHAGHSMEMILKKLSKNLFDLAKSEFLMTMLAIEFNPATKVLKYWSGGAPGFVLMNKDGAKVIEVRGHILGYEVCELGHGEIRLETGDRLFLFTDGIVEMELPEGRRFSDRQLVKFLTKLKDKSPESIRDAVIQEVDLVRGEGVQNDDFTFVAVEIT